MSRERYRCDIHMYESQIRIRPIVIRETYDNLLISRMERSITWDAFAGVSIACLIIRAVEYKFAMAMKTSIRE